MMKNRTGCGKAAKVVLLALALAAAVGSAPVFSQQITALFGLGYHATDQEAGISNSLDPAIEVWTNVMFTGKSGLTVSLGYDTRFMFLPDSWGNSLPGTFVQASSDISIGIGYVRQDFLKEGVYVGGLLSALPRLSVPFRSEGYYTTTYGDVFLAPTLVGGCDLGPLTLGVQLMYMRGMFSGYNGFKFLVGAGVTFDFGSAPANSAPAASDEEYASSEDDEPEEEPEPELVQPWMTRRR